MDFLETFLEEGSGEKGELLYIPRILMIPSVDQIGMLRQTVDQLE